MGVSIAHSFAQVISSWDGPVVVGLADGSTYEVPAGTDLVLSELGAVARWPGVEPTGIFWPWSAVTSIRQAASAPPDSPAPVPDSPPAGTSPESSQASPPAGDAAPAAGPQTPAPPAAPPAAPPQPARDT